MIKLETIESEFGTITVLKKRSTDIVSYQQGGFCQSEADRNGVSLAAYIHAIFGLIIQKKARNVLVIGCAGGTLATMLANAGCKVTVIDVNPDSFVLAKRYFALPDTVECHVKDGKSFLYSDTQRYDAIVLDAFHGHHIPAHLKSVSFYYLVADRLTQRGALFANIHVQHDFDIHADRIAGTLSRVFHDVRLLDSEGLPSRNAIVMAGAVSNLIAPKLLLLPQADHAAIEAELATLKFRVPRPV
jgi:spermidine synthase